MTLPVNLNASCVYVNSEALSKLNMERNYGNIRLMHLMQGKAVLFVYHISYTGVLCKTLRLKQQIKLADLKKNKDKTRGNKTVWGRKGCYSVHGPQQTQQPFVMPYKPSISYFQSTVSSLINCTLFAQIGCFAACRSAKICVCLTKSGTITTTLLFAEYFLRGKLSDV